MTNVPRLSSVVYEEERHAGEIQYFIRMFIRYS